MAFMVAKSPARHRTKAGRSSLMRRSRGHGQHLKALGRIVVMVVVSLSAAACGGVAARNGTPTATAAAATASPTPTATPDVPAVYVVKSGDTGLEIAARFGITLAELARANNMTETQMDFLQIGQQLRIPR